MRCLSPADPSYPRPLLRLERPLALYYRGDLPGPCEELVAVVGTRGALVGSLELARGVAAAAVRAGRAVVSGGALGVDAAAHEGALAAGGRTVAILGSSLDLPYPARNIPLFERVVDSGAVASSFPPGSPPRRPNFPQRNALIAAWAAAVVVVEAPARSGALNTAAWARRLGVRVFAADRGAGCRRLLQGGAGLLREPADLTDALASGLVRQWVPRPESDDQRQILRVLGGQAMFIDEVAQELGWRVSRAAAGLVRMELIGIVSPVPGGRFMPYTAGNESVQHGAGDGHRGRPRRQ